MAALQKNYDKDIHLELLMRFVVLRIANDIDFLESKVASLEAKISKPKKSIFNLDMIDENSRNASMAELIAKKGLFKKIIDSLEKNSIALTDTDLSNKINKLFASDNNGALRYSFLIQVIEFPIYAGLDKKFIKENSKDKSFERISYILGYDYLMASNTEKLIYKILADISDVNVSKIILQTAIPIIAVSLLLPFAVELFAGVGLFGGAVYTKGLATLGGSIIGGLSILSFADILIGATVVYSRVKIEKDRNSRMSALNVEVIKADGTNLILLYSYLNNKSDELSKIQQNNLVKDFLLSKNSYEESNILSKNGNSDSEVLNKLRVANNISREILKIKIN
jgi:hypothetical protein